MSIDRQKAATDAMALVMLEALTEPMTAEDLCRVFGLGFRSMKAHLETIEHQRVGSMYRLPVRSMPPNYLVEFLPIIADSCAMPHEPHDIA